MTFFEVQQSYERDGDFYSFGIQDDSLVKVWNHLENNLAAWHQAMTHYAIPIEFGCTCPEPVEGPQVPWMYAKDTEGNLSQPLRIDYEQMARHITGTADESHVVTISPVLHLRTVEY